MKTPIIQFPKNAIRAINRIRKKTAFRFDPIPSGLSEDWLSEISGPQLKCYFFICRRTLGFQKEWDAISNEQFQFGVVDKNGKHIDCGTGLSESAIRDANEWLELNKLIEIRRKSHSPNEYRINTVRVCRETPLPAENERGGVCHGTPLGVRHGTPTTE